MAWHIKCSNKECEKTTTAGNIVYLINYHLDENGWILCGHCGNKGYIEKHFDLQEEGETWDPYLRGIITLGNKDDVYQPFVFLVSDKPNAPIGAAWFSYYKDTRSSGGRLKMGYGPGGPPVLDVKTVAGLGDRMRSLGISVD